MSAISISAPGYSGESLTSGFRRRRLSWYVPSRQFSMIAQPHTKDEKHLCSHGQHNLLLIAFGEAVGILLMMVSPHLFVVWMLHGFSKVVVGRSPFCQRKQSKEANWKNVSLKATNKLTNKEKTPTTMQSPGRVERVGEPVPRTIRSRASWQRVRSLWLKLYRLKSVWANTYFRVVG